MLKTIFVRGKPRPYSLIANAGRYSFKPDRLVQWQTKISNAVGRILDGEFQGVDYLRLDLVFCFTTQKARKAGGLAFHDKRPDFDNLRKSVQDALKDVTPDDSKIVIGTTTKILTPHKEGVVILLDSTPLDVFDELEILGINPQFLLEQ